ncbi:MAG: DUF4384 domain-containing protein [Gammaproteobacteria bacterium]|nr:DUF4384 domain-containing protein [Gammaproteobacteria bacterium]
MTKLSTTAFTYVMFTYVIIVFPLVHATPEPDSHQRHINIDITSHLGDNQIYTEGDVISLYVSLDRDAFVLIFYQDAGGNLNQIIPNKLSSDHFFRAGDFFSVPNLNSPFKFTISEPFGTEYLWAFASNKSFPTLRGIPLKNGFILLKDRLDTIRKLLQLHAKNENGYFGQAKAIITTKSATP